VVATVLAGAGLLALAFDRPRDSAAFYVASFGAAAVWILGGLLTGGVHLGTTDGVGRAVSVGVLVGAGLFGAFVVAREVVSHLAVLDAAVGRVLGVADTTSLPLVLLLTTVSAVGEEVFFRGALMDVLPDRWSVIGSTAIYVLVTGVTRNWALVVAAAVLGLVCAVERQRTGGVVAPAVTHSAWSALMVVALPR
jgi:membrane protease YdiL (CAAX protease family)